MEIYSTKAVKGVDPYTAWFLYGGTGSGKTRAAATFPKPFFWVPDNENSHLSLRDRDLPYTILGKENGRRVKVRQQVASNLAELKKMANEADAYLARAYEADDAGETEKADEFFAKADKAFPYQTIVTESLTHLNELLVEEIGAGGTGASKGKMDQQKWGELATFYRNMNNALRSLPVHVVYTSLDTFDADSETGLPYISGKTARVLPSACDVVGYCEEASGPKGESVYRIHFRRYRAREARSRFATLPRFVDNFDFEALHKEGLFEG